jgi:hypothetical protein
VVRRAPQRLNAVHRRAVAGHGNHGTIGHRDLDPDRTGQTLADAAAAAAEIIAEAAVLEGARQIETCRDALVDDDDIVGQTAPEFRGDARHGSRLAIPRLFHPRLVSLLLPRAALRKHSVAPLR